MDPRCSSSPAKSPSVADAPLLIVVVVETTSIRVWRENDHEIPPRIAGMPPKPIQIETEICINLAPSEE